MISLGLKFLKTSKIHEIEVKTQKEDLRNELLKLKRIEKNPKNNHELREHKKPTENSEFKQKKTHTQIIENWNKKFLE